MRDVIVVDDDKDYLESYIVLIESQGYNARGFTDFTEALRYIQHLSERPLAVFVDMKPLGWLRDDNISELTDDDRKLLALPEQIFSSVKEKGWQDNFFFITGCQSKHDDEVTARTGAPCVTKDELANKVDEIFKRALSNE